MIIGERITQLRKAKGLSQGDIEKRTGLLRCYISRVENGHTVPAIETLEKIARAVEIELYQLFIDGDPSAKQPGKNGVHVVSIQGGKQPDVAMRRLMACWPKMDSGDKRLVLGLAQKLAKHAA